MITFLFHKMPHLFITLMTFWWVNLLSKRSNFPRLIGKTFACQKLRNKYDKNSGSFYLSEISRGLVMWASQGTPSKVKDKLLYLAPPTTKKETQCLVSLFGFWVYSSDPFIKWTKRLWVWVGPRNKTRLCNRSRLPWKSSAIWAIWWSSRSSYTSTVSSRYKYCLSLLTYPHRWIRLWLRL